MNALDAVWPLPASPEQVAEWREAEALKLPKALKAGDPRLAFSPELLERYGLVPRKDATPSATSATNATPGPASAPATLSPELMKRYGLQPAPTNPPAK